MYEINKITLREKVTNIDELNKQILISKSEFEVTNNPMYLSRLGELLRINGQLELSKSSLTYCLSIIDKSNLDLIFITKLRLAITYQFLVDYKVAETLFEDLESNIQVPYLESYIYQHRGKLEFEKGNYKRALELFNQAKNLRGNDKDLLKSTEFALNHVANYVSETS